MGILQRSTTPHTAYMCQSSRARLPQASAWFSIVLSSVSLTLQAWLAGNGVGNGQFWHFLPRLASRFCAMVAMFVNARNALVPSRIGKGVSSWRKAQGGFGRHWRCQHPASSQELRVVETDSHSTGFMQAARKHVGAKFMVKGHPSADHAPWRRLHVVVTCPYLTFRSYTLQTRPSIRRFVVRAEVRPRTCWPRLAHRATFVVSSLFSLHVLWGPCSRCRPKLMSSICVRRLAT